jgi:flagellar secretion chaperone FliS
MALNKFHSQYKENSIYTATPEELTMMLYNGLVRFILQSQKAIDDKDIPKSHECVIRAQDIIQEFMASLDMKYDLSQGLMLMYDYMYRRLMDANIKKDRVILEEVLGYAKEMRDTWAQAMKLAKQHPPMPETIAK